MALLWSMLVEQYIRGGGFPCVTKFAQVGKMFCDLKSFLKQILCDVKVIVKKAKIR